ncbi:(3S)-malyl-CoA thioesterase [Geodia barretti]|uniref:(3S)-malyl-CoA thioesterase n=1 Tax=Geodia barretti TaxID=519541 RepID=A0AA35TFU0_GEOBA|nr:(3S)-malyl-CoA thioesterase [Geodia barretti]
MAAEWVPRLAAAGRRVMVRVNSLDTGLTSQELDMVVCPELAGISVGKGDSAWDLQQVDRLLGPLESRIGIPRGTIRWWPWMKPAMDSSRLMMAPRISAHCRGRIRRRGLHQRHGGDPNRFWRGCYYARSAVAVAARAARVAALDGPFVGFRDPDGLRTDAGTARQIGFTGKFAIHPAQIDIINETFSPHPDDVEYARTVVAAWEEAESAGRGSLSIDGECWTCQW